MNPLNSSFHYAVECYEGMKAYKTDDGKINTFRYPCNMYRMKTSMWMNSLPDFDGNEFL